jgi:hypothetical protein
MRQYCREYDGGEWDFYIADGDAYFMACADINNPATLFNPENGREITLDIMTTGMLVTLSALGRLMNVEQNVDVHGVLTVNHVALYEALRETVGEEMFRRVRAFLH